MSDTSASTKIGKKGLIERLSARVAVTSRSPIDTNLGKNAALLTKAGYIAQLAAGVYAMLPLGLRVLNRVEAIVREEMNALGASEILTPVMYPKELWTPTGRWDGIDVLYKVTSRTGAEFCLPATAEEVLTFLEKARFVRTETCHSRPIRSRLSVAMSCAPATDFYGDASSV